MTSVRESYISSDETFTSADGLMIAFGLTAFDDNEEPIEDESYGRIKAYYKTWGLDDDY